MFMGQRGFIFYLFYFGFPFPALAWFFSEYLFKKGLVFPGQLLTEFLIRSVKLSGRVDI